MHSSVSELQLPSALKQSWICSTLLYPGLFCCAALLYSTLNALKALHVVLQLYFLQFEITVPLFLALCCSFVPKS